jgi:magnesium transporter
MLYLSSYLGTTVVDAAGRPVGKVLDVVARLGGEYPLVSAVRVRTARGQHLDVGWEDVRAFEESRVFLSRERDALAPYALGDQDVLLARNVLDKQIVDLEGRRLIRVQDVELSRTGTRLRVLGVDVSTSALVRRLGLRKTAERIGTRRPPTAVSWEDLDLGSWHDPNVRLRVTRSGLKRLHPADLAEIAADLPPGEGVELLESVDEEVAADILEELGEEDAVRMLEALGPERAAELLAKMSPDDAADLIQDLDRADGEALLSMLPPEEAAEIRSLLGYEEESAGGIMTTEFVSASARELAGDVIERLRRRQPDEEHAHHLFVVDEDELLVGQLSLYELVIADPRTPVGDLMHEDPVSVMTSDDEDEIVEAVMKYNLLAVPVVDEQERLVGVITVDDVIDLVGPRRGSKGLLG